MTYRANFLWGFEDGSLESIGYEFCNAKTEEYCRMQWTFLKEKIANAYNTASETAAERDRLWEEIKELNKRIEELRDAATTHYRKLYGYPENKGK